MRIFLLIFSFIPLFILGFTACLALCNFAEVTLNTFFFALLPAALIFVFVFADLEEKYIWKRFLSRYIPTPLKFVSPLSYGFALGFLVMGYIQMRGYSV